MHEPKAPYLRANIIDFMPDPLSPLSSTMGTSIYNRTLDRMRAYFKNLKEEIDPSNIIVTSHDYAYDGQLVG